MNLVINTGSESSSELSESDKGMDPMFEKMKRLKAKKRSLLHYFMLRTYELGQHYIHFKK